jgi:PhnB protein
MRPEDGDRIMHISLPVSQETVIMGSDVGGEWASSYKQGNNFSISINTDSKAETERLFNGLSANGQVTMPLEKTFWGDYFGMFIHQFGVNWMISFNENPKEK